LLESIIMLDPTTSGIIAAAIIGSFIVLIIIIKIAKRPTWRPIGENEYVIISGSSTGIGKTTALYLSEKGYHVFAGVRKTEDGEKLKSQAKFPERVIPVILDVTNKEHLSQAYTLVKDTLGENKILRGLFINQGINHFAPVESVKDDKVRNVMEVNFFGSLAMLQTFMPFIKESKGSIIFTGSLAGRMAVGLGSAFHCSKFALEALADSLRRELYGTGINVVVLDCASLKTEVFGKSEFDLNDDPIYESHNKAIKQLLKIAHGRARDPIEAAVLVEEAMRSSNPESRYYPGGGAGGRKVLAYYFSDKAADWVLYHAVKHAATKYKPNV